jgi:hypothetical protein
MRDQSVANARGAATGNEWLTTGDVARVLQISRNGVRWLVRQRRLTCEWTHSGVRLFRSGMVLRLMQQRATARIQRRGERLATLRLHMLRADLEPRQLSLDFHARLQLVGSRGKGRRVA